MGAARFRTQSWRPDVDTTVVADVEMPVESSIQVRMLGRMTIRREGVALELPASRKVRALFAYLALAPRAVTRSQLCDLLWEVPSDPRGELRWCLSKIRNVVDEGGRHRVASSDDTIRLDLSDCFVDAIEVERAIDEGIQALTVERLRALSMLFAGDLLEGLEIDRSPAFDGWLTSQRRRFRACQAAVLERLVNSVSDDESFGYLEKWLQLAPFDRHVHEFLLTALARQSRIREGEEHLAATARRFDAEGLDSTPIRDAWRTARTQGTSPPRARGAAPALTVETGSGDDGVATAARRASLAVMPFVDASTAANARGGVADALAHDIITRLAKLRILFVIAQGSVFALHERRVGPEEAGRMLNVDYVASGSVRQDNTRLIVTVELTETRTARIVWAEIFNQNSEDAFLVLDEIGNRIVASIASEIETIERNRAILRPPNSLDAWEAHHRGLWHVYLFNKLDNERAGHFFEEAVSLDPTFARAHAGLSFTHFTNAFQGWAKREVEIDHAFEAAGRSLMVDDRDPAAHIAMGRALWLRGRDEQSIAELERAIDLSPSFAPAHYSLAFVRAQTGDPRAAILSSDLSLQLSPFDPMLFAIFGTRAVALVRLGRFEEAAAWAIKAAARPNAHPYNLAIAACSLALAGSLDDARGYAANHRAHPQYSIDSFLTSVRLDPQGAALFRKGAKRIGMT